MLKCFIIVQCLGDGGCSRVLASVFVCLLTEVYNIFGSFPYFRIFIRFPNSFHQILILIRTLQLPHVTHKFNGQLQEAECTIMCTRQ